jgi:transposase
VSRAAWRLKQAERERGWALASARAEGVSIRALAAAAGLSASWVYQIVAAADLDELDAALGELRAGRPRNAAYTVAAYLA